MKPISARQIAVVFTGSFLGAGFLSGQELLQFFGVFGGFGLVGMALAILAFVGFSRMVMEIAQETGRTEFDHIIVYRDLRWLRLFVEGVFLFFLFDVMVAMLAGAGALLEQVFGLRAVAGDALISLLVLAVALAGAAGLLASFSLVVPLLVAAAIAIGVAAFCTLSPAPLEMKPLSSGNPLLGNWFFSALSFISYNMMAAVSILVPLTEGTGERKTIHRGLGLGALLLTLIFACILLPMTLYPDVVAHAELPIAGPGLPAHAGAGLPLRCPALCRYVHCRPLQPLRHHHPGAAPGRCAAPLQTLYRAVVHPGLCGQHLWLQKCSKRRLPHLRLHRFSGPHRYPASLHVLEKSPAQPAVVKLNALLGGQDMDNRPRWAALSAYRWTIS